MRGVTIYNKVLARIGRSKHWSGGELVLEGLETFLTFVCPLKFNTFVKQISQGLGNLGEILDESATITSEAEETSDLLGILRRSPVTNSLNTLRVNGNSVLGNDMSKVGYFRKPEFTLGVLGIQLVLSKSL